MPESPASKKRVLSSPRSQSNPAKPKQKQMANFTASINALVGERDRQFVERIAKEYNLPLAELHAKYVEVAEVAIKLPRKYTKKPKAVTVVEEGAPPDVKPPKEPKAKAEKQKCTACTSKKEACKFSALKGEVFCKRHLRASQEEAGAEPKAKPAKKAVKAAQPVHTHELTQQPTGPCDLCESHGNPLEPEAEFEVVLGESGTKTVAERLAEILAEPDAESESESEFDGEMGLTEEGFEDE